MLEDFKLKVFLAVVQERSFTKAAAQLGISQPAVSQNVAELEKMLDRKLFDRLKGEVVLTTEGSVFLTYVERLMQTCSSMESMFVKLSPAKVRISASEEVYSYLVGPALEAFASIHPEITFERCLFEDADLSISLVPSQTESAELPSEDVIARIRMSMFVPVQSDSLSSSQEKCSYFDIVYRPSQTFACTRLCRLIRQFLAK